GANSIIYGSTREHLLEIKALLSDGSEAVFKDLDKEEFFEKCKGKSLESRIYRTIYKLLSDPVNQREINKEFQKASIKRRNTGYAIDMLLRSRVFGGENNRINLCDLIAGSEGTLAFVSEVKLNLVPIPSGVKGLLCAHFSSVGEALLGNRIAMDFN